MTERVVFTGKGDPMECGSYRAIKLLERVIKLIEHAFECKVVLVSVKGTTDAIFRVRQTQEKYGSKGKNLCFAFVDLEKAFDRVPRQVTRWAL